MGIFRGEATLMASRDACAPVFMLQSIDPVLLFIVKKRRSSGWKFSFFYGGTRLLKSRSAKVIPTYRFRR